MKAVVPAVKAIIAAVISPGAISGRVTFQKACNGVAPIIIAASSYIGSVVAREDWMERTTNGIAPMAVATTMIGKLPRML